MLGCAVQFGDFKDCSTEWPKYVEKSSYIPAEMLGKECDCTPWGSDTANGVDVTYGGCWDHINSGTQWCYVVGGQTCERAARSTVASGAFWVPCVNASTPPPAPETMAPTAPPRGTAEGSGQIPTNLKCSNYLKAPGQDSTPARRAKISIKIPSPTKLLKAREGAKTPAPKAKAPGAPTRVVGGTEAVQNSHPWIVRLGMCGYLCGGTIINERFILTAAHCVFDETGTIMDTSCMTVYAGDHDAAEPDLNEQQLAVKAVYAHDDYNPSVSSANDIAILELRVGVIFTDGEKSIKPACLPEPGFVLPEENTNVYIAGWGVTDDKSTARYLQEGKVDYIPDAECKTMWGILDAKTMLCAGKRGGKIDTCQGDSGGPLIYAKGSTALLVGVVSFGAECGAPNAPGVYVDVVNFLDWINGVVGGTIPAKTLSAAQAAKTGVTEQRKVKIPVTNSYTSYMAKQKVTVATSGTEAPGTNPAATRVSINGATCLLSNPWIVGCALMSALLLRA
jgi:secreted trypsin-like serine protease